MYTFVVGETGMEIPEKGLSFVPETVVKTEIDQTNLVMRKATSEDVNDLLIWDEEAKKASTGEKYSQERIQQRRNELQEMITNPDCIIRIVEVFVNTEDKGLHKESIGMIMAEKSVQRNPIKFIGEPYVLEDTANRDKEPLALSQIEQYIMNPNRVHLLSVAISPECRGQGIGKKTINLFFAELSESGAEVITFDTGVENLVLQKRLRTPPISRLKIKTRDTQIIVCLV